MCNIAGINFLTNIWNAPVPLTKEDIHLLSCSQDTGAIVFKTRTLNPKIGNPNDWTIYDWGSQNNIGLHNDGINELVTEINSLSITKPIFISLFGTPNEMKDMKEIIQKITFEKVLIEWNLSCPNTEIFLPTLEEFIEVKKSFKFPLGIKISYQYEKYLHFFDHADFITAINSIDGKAGKIIHKTATEVVRIITCLTNTPVIGCGGIDSKDSYFNFINAGAIATEVGTEFLKNKQVFNIFNTHRYTIAELKQNDIVQHGSFICKSGEASNIYIDFRKILSNPNTWASVVNYVLERIYNLDFDYVCGVPIGGIPLASIVSVNLGKPLLLCREAPKTHGLCKQIEGDYLPNKKCLVIEDVITTGNSSLTISKILKDNNLKVDTIFALLNRSSKHKIDNIKILSLYNLQDFYSPIPWTVVQPSSKFQRLLNIIAKKQTKLCFAADFYDNFLSVVESVAPYICLLKIHPEIIPKNIGLHILSLSIKYNFMILIDRKFADIGNSVLKQLQNLKENLPCDFVTAHITSGKEMIKNLCDNVAVFLVAQMSSSNKNCLNTQKTLSLASEFGCGLVAQERLHPFLVHLTAGVSLNSSHDNFGQKYRTPESTKFADVVVVGRDIYDSPNPNEVAFMYKEIL